MASWYKDKKRLSDELKKNKSINDLKEEFLFEEYNVPKDFEKFVDSLNIFKNDMIFQGTLVYAKGTAQSLKKVEKELGEIYSKIYKQRILKRDGKGTLRPTYINLVTNGKDNYKIKIALIFSHNKYLRSYLYNFPDDYVFVLDPNLTRKYLKQNRRLMEHDFVEGFQVFYVNNYLNVNQELLEKVKYARFLKKRFSYFYRDKKTYDKFADRMNEIFNENWFGFVEGLE